MRAQGLDDAIQAAAARAQLGPDDFAPERDGRLNHGLRSGVLKATRSVVENQGAIDAAMLEAIRRLGDEVARLHVRVDSEVGAHAELSAAALAALRRLERQQAQQDPAGP